ncbi:nuclear transport factor 2 family protein [Chloroflexota bacterium]
MTEPGELERRIRVLEDIEAIKKLKASYFRCLDKKLWQELGECLARDALGEKESKLQGKEAIVEYIKGRLGKESIVTAHHGHNPEIELTGETTARGTWQLRSYRTDTETNEDSGHMSFYQDEYVKENGKWRIKSTVCIGIATNVCER